MGGWCQTQIVDISKREEVYKAADEIRSKYGNVSLQLINDSAMFSYIIRQL